MTNEIFVEFIRKRIMKKNIPIKKLELHPDIYISILNKEVKGQNIFSSNYLKSLTEILKLELKKFQTIHIANKIKKNF